MKFRLLSALCLLQIGIILTFTSHAYAEQPNILWITSEDNGRFLGCYGDENAATPNLDSLAARGVRFTHCYANAPVCAVTRSGWITGVPAVTLGTQNMRSTFKIPTSITPYPTLLKRAGYYCTNNHKTDYNTRSFGNDIWDQCDGKAHFKNCPADKPFFAVFNFTNSHEGQIFPAALEQQISSGNLPSQPRVDNEKIVLPPYQVNTPEMIYDWQRMYDQIDNMDAAVGKLLQELKASGRAENTIIIYNSDHGGITLRSKRFMYDSGTRVPLIVVFPESLQPNAPSEPGSTSDRLVQFMDFPPTLLALCGVEIPTVMTGKIFLGEKTQTPPKHIFMFTDRFDESPDMRRGLADGRWKYIRNFQPDRLRFQMLTYPFTQLGQQSQWREFNAGKTNEIQSAFYQPQPIEELYDTHSDPHEVNNLAADPAYADRLKQMQTNMQNEMLSARDTGFIPEPMLADIDNDPNQTIYGFAKSKNYRLASVLSVAYLATRRDPQGVPQLINFTSDPDPIVRYWATVGLRVSSDSSDVTKSALEKLTKDSDLSVRVTAATALGNIGEREQATKQLVKEAQSATTDAGALWALDGLKFLDAADALDGVTKKSVNKGGYSLRTFEFLKSGGGLHTPPR